MAIHESESLLHWNYFLALEADVERLARFVEFTTSNFDVYSIEIAHLFLAAASEVDVVTRQLCNMMDKASNATNIEQYRDVLRRSLPEIERSKVFIPRYGLELKPWSNWQRNETPDWWRAHNKVKHNRGEFFCLANLQNVLNAMAALCVIVIYYYRNIGDRGGMSPPPNLFAPPEGLAYVCATMGGGIALHFKK